MSIEVRLKDGKGTGNLAKVTSRGQLVVGASDFSTAYSVEVNATGTAFNFIEPIGGKIFVITGILLYANKDVGVNDATVEIYEATAIDSTVVVNSVLTTEMVKQTNRDLLGLTLKVSEGFWLNIKTDDATIFATVLGYYTDL